MKTARSRWNLSNLKYHDRPYVDESNSARVLVGCKHIMVHFADLVWLREALLAARRGPVVDRATNMNLESAKKVFDHC